MTKELLSRQHLPQQIANRLRKEILQHHCPGRRLQTENELASRFGVSIRTVREALGALEQEKLIVRKQGRGTMIADHKTEQHIAVVLAVLESPLTETYHYIRVTQQLSLRLSRQGFPTRTYWVHPPSELLGSDASFDEFSENITKALISGVVLVRGRVDEPWRDLIREKGVPVVGRGCFYNVDLDLVQMVQDGARYLLERGCRKIALMAWRHPTERNRQTDAVYQAFRAILEQKGVEARDAWIVDERHPTLPGAGYTGFKQIWAAGPDKPDGLLICDDNLYRDAVSAILELGVAVPGQLKVVTLANKGSGVFYPIPTIRMETDPDQFAEHLSGMLIKLIRQETVPEPKILLPLRWIESDTQQAILSPSLHEVQTVL